VSNSLITPFLPPWMPIAIKELGVSEVKGNLHNPKILEYHKTTTLAAKQDEVSWCSSFVNWVMKQAGIKGTGLANAQSWLKWGVGIDVPIYGSIVVLKRGKEPWMGHVGFLVYDSKERMMILGGNQGDKVSIAPFSKKDLLGIRLI